MAGWTHVGVSGVNPTTESVAVNLVCPAGTQVGDLMCAVVACETEGHNPAPITPPAGWTEIIQHNTRPDMAANHPVLAVFYRIATSDDVAGTTTYSFSWAHTATARVGAIVTKRGVHRTSPHVMTPAPRFFKDQTNIDGGDIIIEAATDLALLTVVGMDDFSRTWTPPSEYTERYDAAGTGTGNDDHLSLGVFDDDSALNGSHVAVASGFLFQAIGIESVFRRNPSPLAPSPAAPANFSSDQAQTWTHNFSDDMPGDVQTARQWRVFRVSDGALVHDTGKVATASLEYILPASTLPNGSKYQRQVRVWDIDDNVSAWSNLQSFYVSAAPVATITSPTEAQVVGASSHDIVIDYTDLEGEAKSAYQVIVTRTDVAETILDTGKVLSTADPQTQQVTGLENAGAYTVEAYVWDHRGIKSAADTVNFTVDYAEPPQPTGIVADGGHFLRLGITNPSPTGAEVVAAYNDIFRREVGGEWIRIVAELDVNESYDDHAVASGVIYEYKVTAYTGGGGARDSEVASGFVTLAQTWFHDPVDPSGSSWGTRSRRLARSHSKELEVAMMRFDGRIHPVAEFGDAINESVTFNVLMLKDTDELETWRALVARKTTVCYRDSRGRKVFGVISNLTEDDHPIGAEVPIQVTATHYTEAV